MDRYRVRLPDGATTEIACDSVRRGNGGTFDFVLKDKLVAVIAHGASLTLIEGGPTRNAVSETHIPDWSTKAEAPASKPKAAPNA